MEQLLKLCGQEVWPQHLALYVMKLSELTNIIVEPTTCVTSIISRRDCAVMHSTALTTRLPTRIISSCLPVHSTQRRVERLEQFPPP